MVSPGEVPPKKATGQKPAAKKITAQQAPVKKVTAAPSAVKRTTGAQPSVKKLTGQQAPVPEPGPPKGKKAILIGLGIGLAVSIGIAVALFAFRDGPESAPEHPPKQTQAAQAEKIEPQPDSLEQKFNEVIAKTKDRPVEEQLKLWSDFLKQTNGGWYQREARGRVRELEDKLAEVASQTFERIQKETDELVAKQKYAEAIQLWQGFPKHLDPYGSYAVHIQSAVEKITVMQKSVDAFAKAGALADQGKYDEAVKILEGLAESSMEAKEKLDEIKVKRCLARVKPLLEKRRREAPERLKKARESLAKELTARQQQVAAVEQKMKGKSVVVKLRHGTSERQGTVTAFGGETITFDFGTVPVDALHPKTLLDLWRQCTGPNDARGHYEMGRCYVRLRDFTNAHSAFQKAIQIDPKLEPIVPDLEAIRKKAVSINGEYSFAGNVITIEYAFRKEEEVADFSVTGCKAKADKGLLTVTGDLAFYLYHKDVPFEKGLSLSAELDAGKGATHLIAFEYVDTNNHTVDLMVLIEQPKSEVRIVRLTKPGAEQVREDVLVKPTYIKGVKTIEYDVREGRAVFSANGQKLLEVTVGKFTNPRAAIGGEAPESAANGTVMYRKLTLKGPVQQEWIMKLQSESEVILERELNKEQAILADEKADLSGRELQETTLDPLIEGLPDGMAGKLMNAQRRINTLLKWRNDSDFEQALEQLEGVRKAMDNFPLVHYYLGRLYHAVGLQSQALKSMNRAIELEPSFPEPYVFRARMSIGSGQYEAGAEDLAKVEKLMPDLPELFAERASLRLREVRRKEALEDVLMARQLRPWDMELLKLEKKIRNVLRGPLWTKTYTRETEHYIVKTDISQERCDTYAENLEIVLKHFEEFFEFKVPTKHKDEVLIFNTAEGYYTYADLTLETRMEHSLGYFEPVYRQFLFYEMADHTETLRTLYHEQFHHFIDHILPAIPVWLNEGMAEYFAGLVVDRQAKKIAGAPKIIPWRLSMVHDIIRSLKKGLDFKDLILLDPASFRGENGPYCYAQAWSMIYFFFNYEKGRYIPLLQRYIEELRKGRENEEAMKFSFEQTDFEKIEREWLEYIKNLKP